MFHTIRSFDPELGFRAGKRRLANAQIIPSPIRQLVAHPVPMATTVSAGDKTQCGHYGLKIYPLSDQRYIKQFCHPTICPGSCFGVFKQQWNRWDAACPNWHAGNADAMIGYGNYSPNLNKYTQPAHYQPESADRTRHDPTGEAEDRRGAKDSPRTDRPSPSSEERQPQ